MSFLVIFFIVNSAFAAENSYSLLDHFNTSSVQQRDCPPLFYGPHCNIPYCFPPHGVLMQKNGAHYYCNCTTGRPYVSGIHCENIECQNDGLYSNLTSECKCPDYTYGDFCHWTLWQIILLGLVLLILIVASIASAEKSPCRKHWPSIKQKFSCTPSEPNPDPAQPRDYFKYPRHICESIQLYWRTIDERIIDRWGIVSERFQHYRGWISVNIRKVFTRKPNVDSATPAPEIRIVERVFYRECDAHHDAPPTYLTAMYSEPPKYETATNPAPPPNYTD